MSNTLEQYRQAKQDIQKLHGAAKKELVARFNDLANELLQVQRELREEFGMKLALPTKPRPVRGKKAAPAASPASRKDGSKAAPASPEIAAVEKKLALQHRKLEDAAKGGRPDKPIRDRIYELEDELRLARER